MSNANTEDFGGNKPQSAVAAPGVLVDALRLADDALKSVQRSHGVMLTCYPPRDAWLENRVDEKVRNALRAIEQADRASAVPAITDADVRHAQANAIEAFVDACKEVGAISDIVVKVAAQCIAAIRNGAPNRAHSTGAADQEGGV